MATTSDEEIANWVSQASVAVGAANTGVLGHVIGLVCVGQTIVGGVISSTVIVLLQVDMLPQSSSATQVRVMV